MKPLSGIVLRVTLEGDEKLAAMVSKMLVDRLRDEQVPHLVRAEEGKVIIEIYSRMTPPSRQT